MKSQNYDSKNESSHASFGEIRDEINNINSLMIYFKNAFSPNALLKKFCDISYLVVWELHSLFLGVFFLLSLMCVENFLCLHICIKIFELF